MEEQEKTKINYLSNAAKSKWIELRTWF